MAQVRIDRRTLPRHIGIIMDGNGRWANQRGWERTRGHKAGSKAVRRIVKACRRWGVDVLTLYAFSAQNWGRPDFEVKALMDLLGEFIVREWEEIMDRGIRVVHLGELRRVPKEVRKRLVALEKASQRNKDMTLALALSYGSREELLRATKNLARRVLDGKIEPKDLDLSSIDKALYTSRLPDPDLIIRTGGEMRLSNFLLWQCAYAELYFSEVLWPDFTSDHLRQAIADFQHRRRRFGLTDEQIDGTSSLGDIANG